MDRRPVIIGAAGMAAVTLLALVNVVAPDIPLWPLCICVSTFGGSVIPTRSIVAAHVNERVGPAGHAGAS